MKRVLLSCVMLMLILCLFAGCVQPAKVTPTPSPTLSPRPTPTSEQLFGDLFLDVYTSTPEYGSISSSMKSNFGGGGREGISYRYHFSTGNPVPDSLTFTALPNEGCRFDGWYNWDKLLSTELIYTYTLGGPIDVFAVFSPIDEP